MNAKELNLLQVIWNPIYLNCTNFDFTLSEGCLNHLTHLNDSIDICKLHCRALEDEGYFALNRGLNNLQLSLQIVVHTNQSRLEETFRRETREIKNTIMHPSVGIYRNPRGHKNFPRQVSGPEVDLDGEDLELLRIESLIQRMTFGMFIFMK